MAHPFELRVVTYNVHRCRGMDRRTRPERTAAVLRHVDADVIALQEVVGAGPRGFSQAEAIGAALGMGWVMAPARQLRGHAFGNVVLSRFPIVDHRQHDLSWKTCEARCLQRVDISVGSRVLGLVRELGRLDEHPTVVVDFSQAVVVDHTVMELLHHLAAESGFLALTGSANLRELEGRSLGDPDVSIVAAAFVHQAAKAIGEQTGALSARPDAIVLTGGIARWDELVDRIERRVAWIAPVFVIPGELELEALAEGAGREIGRAHV